jgi:GTPase
MNKVQVKSTDRAIVVGVGLKTEPISEIKENLLELEELVRAAGGEVVGALVQTLAQWNPATLIGTGKVVGCQYRHLGSSTFRRPNAKLRDLDWG